MLDDYSAKYISDRMDKVTFSSPELHRTRIIGLFGCAGCAFVWVVISIAEMTLSMTDREVQWARFISLITVLLGIIAFSVAVATYVIAYRQVVEEIEAEEREAEKTS